MMMFQAGLKGVYSWIFAAYNNPISRSQTRIRVENAVKRKIVFQANRWKIFVICAFKAQGSTEYLTSCREIEAIFEEGCKITLCEV
jgi:hypothetical protein